MDKRGDLQFVWKIVKNGQIKANKTKSFKLQLMKKQTGARRFGACLSQSAIAFLMVLSKRDRPRDSLLMAASRHAAANKQNIMNSIFFILKWKNL
jgi:hypothetical protein